MKDHKDQERKTKERYHTRQDFNKRNYRLEKNIYGDISDRTILRFMAERRYL